MPDKTSPEDSTEQEEAKGGSKRLIIIVVICLVIGGAGFVVGGRLSGGAEVEAADEEEEVEEAEEVIGHIVDLEPVNVNLADGRYLRIAVALGLSEHVGADEEGGGGGHGGGGDEEISFETAPASDLVVTTFSGRLFDDLSTHDGRESARHDLLEGLENYYGEDVLTVLFTEFVMQ